MKIPVNLNNNSYDIILAKAAIDQVDQEVNLQGKVLLVTDDGVPKEYINKLLNKCRNPILIIIPQGEASKSFTQYKNLLQTLINHEFTRTDLIIAVGGGVVGDLAGFVAATYMRGIDFINIPTTLLSQLDSSLGGKTAINFKNIKNIVGAFHQPKKVIIDPEVLHTLSPRQMNAGLAEAIKMATTSDANLFSLIANQNAYDNLEEIIKLSLQIKSAIIEKDVNETGLRKVLNFGHTVGHAIESQSSLLHGESIAIGMLYFCSEQVRLQLQTVLEKYKLPIVSDLSSKDIYQAIVHDKKVSGDKITIVYVASIGSFEFKTLPLVDLKKIIENKE